MSEDGNYRRGNELVRIGADKMNYYHAEVINLSLKDKNMLKKFPVISCKKRFWGLCKIYTIAIPEKNIAEVVKAFQENMSTALKKEWYITFHTSENVIVVFREKSFALSGKGICPIPQKCIDTSCAEEKEKWDEMVQYARALGIPDEQCDFCRKILRCKITGKYLLKVKIC